MADKEKIEMLSHSVMRTTMRKSQEEKERRVMVVVNEEIVVVGRLWNEIVESTRKKNWGYAEALLRCWIRLYSQYPTFTIPLLHHITFRSFNDLRFHVLHNFELLKQESFCATLEKKTRIVTIGLTDGAHEFENFFKAMFQNPKETASLLRNTFKNIGVNLRDQDKPSDYNLQWVREPIFVPDILIFGDSGYRYQMYQQTCRNASGYRQCMQSIYITGEREVHWDRARSANCTLSTVILNPQLEKNSDCDAVARSSKRFIHVPFAIVTLFERQLYKPQTLSPFVLSNKNVITPAVIDDTSSNKKFCAYMYLNGAEERQRFCVLLSETYRKVDILGKDLHETPSQVGADRFVRPHEESLFDSSAKYYFNYKFVICFENASKMGYFTEKIVNAKVAGAIPIVWGAPDLLLYVNKDAVVYIESMEERHLEQAIAEIKFLNEHEVERCKKVACPLFTTKCAEIFLTCQQTAHHMLFLNRELERNRIKYSSVGFDFNLSSSTQILGPAKKEKPFRCVGFVMGMENELLDRHQPHWQSIYTNENLQMTWVGSSCHMVRDPFFAQIWCDERYSNRWRALQRFASWVQKQQQQQHVVENDGDRGDDDFAILITETDFGLRENFLPNLKRWTHLVMTIQTTKSKDKDAKEHGKQQQQQENHWMSVQMLHGLKLCNLPMIFPNTASFLDFWTHIVEPAFVKHPEILQPTQPSRQQQQQQQQQPQNVKEKDITLMVPRTTTVENSFYAILYSLLQSLPRHITIVDWSSNPRLGVTVAQQYGVHAISQSELEGQYKNSALEWRYELGFVQGLYTRQDLTWFYRHLFNSSSESFMATLDAPQTEPLIAKETLIATMFFDIRSRESEDSNSSNKTAEDYFLLGDKLLSWPVNMLIMTEPKWMARISAIRARKGFAQHTLVFPLEIENSALYSLYEENNKLRGEAHGSRIPKRFNVLKDTALYAWCTWQKMECLATALEQQPQFWPHVESIFFIDYGIHHVADPKNSLREFLQQLNAMPRLQLTSLFPSQLKNTPQIPDEKTWLVVISELFKRQSLGLKSERLPFLGYCFGDVRSRETWYSELRQASGGGVVGGPLVYVKWLIQVFIKEISYAVRVLHWGPLEEAVFMLLMLSYPSMFIQIQSDHKEMLDLVPSKTWQTLAQTAAIHQRFDFHSDFLKMTKI